MTTEIISKTIASTITAIMICALTSCKSNNSTDCSRFRTGRFELHSEADNSNTIIVRNDSIQSETNDRTGETVKTKIKWPGDCEYELTFIDQTKKISDKEKTFLES